VLWQYCTSAYDRSVTPVPSLSTQPQTSPGLSQDVVCAYQPSSSTFSIDGISRYAPSIKNWANQTHRLCVCNENYEKLSHLSTATCSSPPQVLNDFNSVCEYMMKMFHDSFREWGKLYLSVTDLFAFRLHLFILHTFITNSVWKCLWPS